jgi:hypothetical protein
MMAIANGFTTLMLKKEVKEKYKKAKAKMEKDLGVTLTHSNAIEVMCDQILSDSITLKMKIVPLQGESK